MDTFNHYSIQPEFELQSEDIKTILSNADEFLTFNEVILYPVEEKLEKSIITDFDPNNLHHVESITHAINKTELVCAGPTFVRDCFNKITGENKLKTKIESTDLLVSDRITLLEYCIKYCIDRKREYDSTGSVKFNKAVSVFVSLNGKKEPSLGTSYHNLLQQRGGLIEIDHSLKLRSNFWNDLADTFKSILGTYTSLYQQNRSLPEISKEIPPRLIVEFIQLFKLKKFANETSLGIIEQELLDRLDIDRARYRNIKSKYKREGKSKNMFMTFEGLFDEIRDANT